MSSERQGFLRDLKVPPSLVRRGLELWPPFLGAGAAQADGVGFARWRSRATS